MTQHRVMTTLCAAAVLTIAACGGSRTEPGDDATVAEPPVVANVTPAGGSVVLANGFVTLQVPPGAVAAPVNVTATLTTAVPTTELLSPGSAVAFTPAGLTFAQPVTLTVDLANLSVAEGVQRRELRLRQVRGTVWDSVPGSTMSATATTITARLTELPTLGIVALPVASVALSPSPETMQVGDSVSVTAVALSADGDTLGARPLRWTSSDSTVARVVAGGLVRATGVGTATITVTAGSVSTSRTVAVVPLVLPVFTDDFESGDFTRRENGVAWTGTSWMDVSTSIARSGRRAARFRQGDSDDFAELRFGGLPQLPEVFLQFWLYMPRGTESPSVGPRVRVLGTSNDKFFRLWGTTDAMYSADPGNKVGASLWGSGGGTGTGLLGLEYQFAPDVGPQWGMGEGPGNATYEPLVSDAYLGRWVRVRIRARVSKPDNRSGVIQLWLDNKLVLSRTDLHNYPRGGVPATFTHGYLLGFANNGYQPGQYMYVDDVWMSGTGFPP